MKFFNYISGASEERDRKNKKIQHVSNFIDSKKSEWEEDGKCVCVCMCLLFSSV